jgi:TonB family protein
MSLLFEQTIKLSLVVVAALVMTALMRRGSAAARHWVLSVAIVCAAAMPLVQLIVPSWEWPGNSSASSPTVTGAEVFGGGEGVTTKETTRRVSSGTSLGLPQMVIATRMIGPLWVAGVALHLSILLVGLVRLASRCEPFEQGPWADMTRQVASDFGLRRRIQFLWSEHPGLLVTWGHLRPKVILPSAARQWPDDRMRIVLSHELAHVQRRDWAVQMLAEAVRCVYWFNPLVWIASRRLRLESEQACDDAVLSRGVEGAAYALHLVELARALKGLRRDGLPAAAMARESTLQRRIKAMLNMHINRRPVTSWVRAGSVTAFLGLATAIAGFEVGAQTFTTLSGSVFDATNRVVPNATLVLTNLQSEAKHEVRSGSSGYFELVGLPPGDYALESRTPGFRKPLGTLTVAGADLRRDVTLQVGALEETMTVDESDDASDDRSLGTVGREGKRDASPCVASTTGGTIRPPRMVRRVRPPYPAHLRGSGVEGTVILETRIAADGTIRDVAAVGEAHPDLAAAAIEAVRQWEFDSTLLNCVPIEVSMTVRVNFRPRASAGRPGARITASRCLTEARVRIER